MVVIMDTSTGRRIEDEEFGAFADEVLYANWIQPLPQLDLQEVVPEMPPQPARREPPRESDEFLRIVYASQE